MFGACCDPFHNAAFGGVSQFNLQIEELPVAQPELEHWKRNVTTPLVLEVMRARLQRVLLWGCWAVVGLAKFSQPLSSWLAPAKP